MIALIQRVSSASVSVDNVTIGEIGRGLLALVAVQPDDTETDAERLAARICGYRVFSDSAGRMNESLVDQGLQLLAVPQFTLAADTRKGMRPSFTRAADPEKGHTLFESVVSHATQQLGAIETGRFGANMQVALVNDGPVTFWLQTRRAD